MFWIFIAFAGLFGFAVKLGQISIWFALLKLALIVAVGVNIVTGIALIFRRKKQKDSQ